MERNYFFHRGNIQSQFFMVCILNSIVSLLILSVIFLFSSYKMIVKRTSEEVEVNLEMASNLLDIQALEVETLARNILSNSVICEGITKEPQAEHIAYPDTKMIQAITNQLNQLCRNNGDIASVYLFNWNGFKYYFRRGEQSTTFSFDFQENLEERWYTRTIEAKGYEQYFLTDVITGQTEDSGVYSVSISKLLLDLKTNEPIGFLIINVNRGHYSNIFPSISGKEVGYAITDPELGTINYIVSSPEMAEKIKKVVLADISGEIKSESNYIITTKTNQRTKWKLYHIAQKKHYIESLRVVLITMLIGLCSLFGFSYIIAISASRRITHPLHQLSYAIQEQSGDMSS